MGKIQNLIFLAVTVIIIPLTVSGQQPSPGGIPQRPIPPKFVNDLAGVLPEDKVESLNRDLIFFDNTTTIQILVVTIDSFEGYDRADFAIRLGEEWGIGETGFDNGVVILVKPRKENQQGEVFIAIGYGLEGVIPDALANRIIENEMIPEFRQNNYYGGIVSAIEVIKKLAQKELTAKEYLESVESPQGFPKSAFLVILVILIIIFSLFSKAKRLRWPGPLFLFFA